MATISTSQIGNTRFWGTPIMIVVTPAQLPSVTFHRIRLVVTIDGREFNFSTPVQYNALLQPVPVTFDISSAFMSVAEPYQYSPDVIDDYPALTAAIDAYDDYIVDGEEHKGTNHDADSVGPFYAGGLTDIERITGTLPVRYSRKPETSKEVCFVGSQHLQPALLTDGLVVNPPSVNTVNIINGNVPDTNIYGTPAPSEAYELRFINSLGVHENVFLAGLPSVDVLINTDKYTISRQQTLTQFSHGLAVKKNNRERWNLSSPPLDRHWQSWYIHELLMARWAWIRVISSSFNITEGELWIPCHIIPEETTLLLNNQSSELLSVPITVELDINGSIYI